MTAQMCTQPSAGRTHTMGRSHCQGPRGQGWLCGALLSSHCPPVQPWTLVSLCALNPRHTPAQGFYLSH